MGLLDQLEGCIGSEDVQEYEDEEDELEEVIFGKDDEIPILENGDRHELLEKTRKWSLKPMTKENSLGAILFWSISLDIDKQIIIIRHGHQESDKIQEEHLEVELNKSGRNFEEQAIIAIMNRRLNKIRDGYRSEDDPPPMKGPMLANIYREKTTLNYPVGVTVKIDGIRCVIGHKEGRLMYRSKKNKEYCHIHEVFDKDIEVFYRYFPPSLDIDGEMYSHKLTFNEITSIFKREINTDHDLIRKSIKYYIFDCNGDGPFEDRFSKLLRAYKKYIKDPDATGIIELVNVVWSRSEEETDRYYKWVLDKGFEGLMIRKLGIAHKESESAYKPGQRCNNILKLKPIIDEEAVVVGIRGGRGREKDKALLIVKDERGNVFSTRPAAGFDLREKWFKDPSLIVGKTVTIEYDSLTEKNIPRQPRSKGFRDYE